MGTTKSFGESKVYRGKNGFTSTFTKVKTGNGSTMKRTGGTSKSSSSKKK
jgi:hypothetical protein